MKLRHLPLIAAIGLFSTVTLAAGYTGPGATPTTTNPVVTERPGGSS